MGQPIEFLSNENNNKVPQILPKNLAVIYNQSHRTKGESIERRRELVRIAISLCMTSLMSRQQLTLNVKLTCLFTFYLGSINFDFTMPSSSYERNVLKHWSLGVVALLRAVLALGLASCSAGKAEVGPDVGVRAFTAATTLATAATTTTAAAAVAD